MGHRLSDTEAMPWSLGKDPNLASTTGLVVLLDRAPEPDRVRATVAATVASVNRMQHKIEEPTATGAGTVFGGPPGSTRPVRTLDPEFELDHHLRFSRLTSSKGGPAGMADLRATAARFINDPFDLGRPLWPFQVLTGPNKGRAALVTKVHHSISDSTGMLRPAGNLLEFEPDAQPPEPVDLDRIFRPAATAADEADPTTRIQAATRSLSSLPSPAQLVEAGVEVANSARDVASQFPKSRASPLWAERSRNRRLEFVSVPTASLKKQATTMGVTVDTLFVAACAQGALHYHRRFDVELASVAATVVISTGSSSPDEELGGAGDNAFLPVAIEIPGTDAEPIDRIDVIRDEVARRRDQLAESGDVLGAIGALTGLVPSSITANWTHQQAARVDFATSNVPGLPVPAWFAGRAVEALYPVGPMSGTAINVTLLTSDTNAGIGIHADPAAIADPALLKRSIDRGFSDFGVARR